MASGTPVCLDTYKEVDNPLYTQRGKTSMILTPTVLVSTGSVVFVAVEVAPVRDVKVSVGVARRPRRKVVTGPRQGSEESEGRLTD